MKRVYGICPCCDIPFRLSEATLFTKVAPPKTVFEKIDEAYERAESRIELFEEREEQQIRDASRRLGRLAAQKRLRKIAPFFVRRKIDPQDVKLLFHPVDYVVFRGMQDDRCASVDFIDHPPNTRERETIQRSLGRSIAAGNLEWQTFRIGESGDVTLDSTGKRPVWVRL
jgi:predicted Holliday junction resolvase-like endonuclease